MQSTELLLQGLAEKKVYYFASQSINSAEPHYWIVVKVSENQIIHFACCTSQFKKRKLFIESRNLPQETLVYIQANDDVPFTKDTYVDCNARLHALPVSDFIKKYESQDLTLKGEVKDSHFQQIITGIHASPLVEEDFKSTLKKEI